MARKALKKKKNQSINYLKAINYLLFNLNECFHYLMLNVWNLIKTLDIKLNEDISFESLFYFWLFIVQIKLEKNLNGNVSKLSFSEIYK